MTDRPPMAGLVKDDEGDWKCPKCGYYSGDAWAQCEGSCPIEGSPWFGCTPDPKQVYKPDPDDIPY